MYMISFKKPIDYDVICKDHTRLSRTSQLFFKIKTETVMEKPATGFCPIPVLPLHMWVRPLSDLAFA